MSVIPKPVEPEHIETPEEKRSRELTEKCEYWVKYWKEEGDKARHELQHLKEAREREIVFANFNPMPPIEVRTYKQYSYPIPREL